MVDNQSAKWVFLTSLTIVNSTKSVIDVVDLMKIGFIKFLMLSRATVEDNIRERLNHSSKLPNE